MKEVNQFFDADLSTGLSTQQVEASRRRFGRNEMQQQKRGLLSRIVHAFAEPMVLFLLAAAILYLVSGEVGDALFMLGAILGVTGISLYQEERSSKALAALNTLTASDATVIRNGRHEKVLRQEVVVDDLVVVEEGSTLPADGIIISQNDFTVNESILTGESMPVARREGERVFQGTIVASGLAICRIENIGDATRLGRIGEQIAAIKPAQTPLQRQIARFVKRMAMIGVLFFVVVWALHYLDSHSLQDSLLKALTLAMSILPEEIPVAFTTFMALGAWRLARLGVVVKNVGTVETLGSATVICVDKTGTITENRMTLRKIYDARVDAMLDEASLQGLAVVRVAMWASEPIPFDPMEKALHEAYLSLAAVDERPAYRMVHEYPLGGKPPMMTHVFESVDGERIIAAKGAPEAILAVCGLEGDSYAKAARALDSLTREGFRVLGVAEAAMTGDRFPKVQQEFSFTFRGFVAFYDPPKKNIASVFDAFRTAGIDVKIVTGDNARTTASIAQQIGFEGADQPVEGDELAGLDDAVLREKVRSASVFTRMYPEAKLRVLNALKANGEVVAMTGDGVNDGPALKAAHIGVAMGKKGTDMAKEASAMILTDDDLARIVDAIAMGRRIYGNLKKAIQYIISIHIPIILTVFIPLILGWVYPAIFSPIHVIFLELIMGPTCSIIYENEPAERNIMSQRPRPFSHTFFDSAELGTSVLQGVVIFLAVIAVYQYAVNAGGTEALTRTLVFVTLVSANIFLTLVNRSFYYSVITTLRYKNPLVPLILAVTVVVTALAVFTPGLRSLFGFEQPLPEQLFTAFGAGALGVLWYEAVKAYKRRR